MRFRLALAEAFGVKDGYELYRSLIRLPDNGPLVYKPVRGILEYAGSEHCELHLIQAPGGKHAIQPPRVIGTGNHRPLLGHTRTHYVARIDHVRVRGASSLVECGAAILFDCEGTEMTDLDTEFAFDASVFAGNNDGCWVIQADDTTPPLRVDEAFSLLGARTVNFGHWIWEHLLKYANARRNGSIGAMPVLLDGNIPPAHRRSLEVLYPDAPIIEVPPYRSIAVDRLWVSPTLQYSSIFEIRNEKFCWDTLICPASDVAPALAEIRHRADLAFGTPGHRKLYFARHTWRHRKMENHARVEDIMRDSGFEIVYPEEHDFETQVGLVRDADVIVAPEGSAIALCIFARRGAQLLILAGPLTDILVTYKPYFDSIGLGVTVIAGPMTNRHEEWEELSDFEIPEDVLLDTILQLQGGG